MFGGQRRGNVLSEKNSTAQPWFILSHKDASPGLCSWAVLLIEPWSWVKFIG